MDHKAHIRLLQVLVSPETLEDSKVWGRELKMLKELNRLYPEDEFWSTWFKPTRYYGTLSVLKAPDGAAELERSWRLYQQNKHEKVLDKRLKDERIAREATEDRTTIPKTPRRQSPIAWADSV